MGEWDRADFIAACSVLTARKTSAAVTVFFSPECTSFLCDVMVVTGFQKTLTSSLHIAKNVLL